MRWFVDVLFTVPCALDQVKGSLRFKFAIRTKLILKVEIVLHFLKYVHVFFLGSLIFLRHC